jgi:mono/diheme cytochrome c family protein
MRHHVLIALLCLAVPAAAGAQSLTRGKYLAEQVGMCHDCHTQRDDKGVLILSEGLRGAPIGFRPMHPMPFAEAAPPIAGLPSGWTREHMVTFLQTGKRPDGSSPRPPMPPYRFNHEDALAVTAWLASLKH